MRRREGPALLAVGALVLAIAGCGAEEFPNDPRPPAPIELSAKISDRQVVVSPVTNVEGDPIGAGLVNVTVSNQTDDSVALEFTGPSDGATDPVVPRGVLEYKIDLEEGVYVVGTDDPAIRDMDFVVGPQRPSAQNDLLLP